MNAADHTSTPLFEVATMSAISEIAAGAVDRDEIASESTALTSLDMNMIEVNSSYVL